MLRDIEVPIVGTVIQNDTGLIVHGKSTLEYGTEVPRQVKAGTQVCGLWISPWRLRQANTRLRWGWRASVRPIFPREPAGLMRNFACRGDLRTCHLPRVSHFAVTARRTYWPVQILHHGVANLPGRCAVSTVDTNGEAPAAR